MGGSDGAGFWSFWVGSLHEFVGWFPGRVPLVHLPSANITIDAAAVSNGQFGIAHDVLRPAVPTDKVTAIGECWGTHRGIICALAPQHASARQPHLISNLCKPPQRRRSPCCVIRWLSLWWGCCRWLLTAQLSQRMLRHCRSR